MEIIAVRTEAEYEGTIHEQSIHASLPDGSEIGLFDPDLVIGQNDSGAKKCITVSTLTGKTDIQSSEKIKKGIKPSPEQPLSWNDHTYCGEISEIRDIHKNSYEVSLDVGLGEIIVWPKKEKFPDLTVGDSLQVNAIRSDVYEISYVVF